MALSQESFHLCINHVLPNEILKNILNKLDLESLGLAIQTCKHWKVIIDKLKLMQKASGKFVVHTVSQI